MPQPPVRLGTPTQDWDIDHYLHVFHRYYQLLSIFTNLIINVGAVTADVASRETAGGNEEDHVISDFRDFSNDDGSSAKGQGR